MLLSLGFCMGTLAAADLSGLIVAEHDGSPVVSAAVTIRRGSDVVAETATDERGVFRAPNLASAEYTLTATKASFTNAERRVALAAAGEDLFVQLTKLGVISGRVTDGKGAAVGQVVVAAVPVQPGIPLRVYNARPKGAATDSRGRYRIFGLPAGDYIVVLLGGNARSMAAISTNGVVNTGASQTNAAQFYPSTRSPVTLSIRSGEEHSDIDFTSYTGPTFSVRGTVSGPSPETPYRLSLVAEGVGVPVASATAQPGKEFVFDRVAPGTYKIVAARLVSNAGNLLQQLESGQIVVNVGQAEMAQILAELRAEAAKEVPSVPAFAEAIVTVTAADMTAIALSARPGIEAKLVYQPAANCPATAQLNLEPFEFLGAGAMARKLDAGQETLIPALPTGAYGVTLNLPETSGCYAATTAIDFRQVSSGTAIPIVAAPLGSAQGKVDTTGYKTEDFTIRVITADGVVTRTLPLAKDSTFSVANLRPGRYRISVMRRTEARVIAADQEVVVESGAAALAEFPALP